MEWFDWKLLLTLGTLVVNAIVLITIKFNDLAHMSKALKELNVKVDKIDERIDGFAERVAKVEGKLESK